MSTALATTLPALFDPVSRYNCYRNSLSIRDKMHGYFRWLARNAAKRDGEPLPSSAGLPWGNAASGPLYFLTDGSDITSVVKKKMLRVSREPPEKPEIRLTFHIDHNEVFVWPLPAHFRAFLLEPEVFARLRRAAAAEAATVPETLSQALRAMNDNLEVARILSAVPELGGQVGLDGAAEAAQGLPASPVVPDLPPRTLVVVVLSGATLDIGPIEKRILQHDPVRPVSLVRQLVELGSRFYPLAGGESDSDQIVATVVGGDRELTWKSEKFAASTAGVKLHGFGRAAALVDSGVVRFAAGVVVVAASRYPVDESWSFYCLADSDNPETAMDLEVFALRGGPIPADASSPYHFLEAGHVLAARELVRQAGWSGHRLDGFRELALARMEARMEEAVKQARERKNPDEPEYILESFEVTGKDLITGAKLAVNARLEKESAE